MENSISVHQRRFEAAVKVMRTLPADGKNSIIIMLLRHNNQLNVK